MRIAEMFLISLALTLVIESVIALLFGVRMPALKVVWLVNVLTNPAAVCAAWLLGMRFPAAPVLGIQLPVEVTVVVTEAMIYRSFARDETWGIRRPVLLALTANLVSWGIGFLMQTVR